MALLSSAVVAGNHAYASEYNNLRTDFVNFTSASTSMTQQALINGNFDIWQRKTTATNPTAQSFVADRWKQDDIAGGGTLPTTIIHSRQSLTPGDIPNSFYFYRINPNGAGITAAAQIGRVYQPVEHGTRLLCGANKTITVAFWARSSIASKRIGIEMTQDYGSGGTPTTVERIVGTNWTLTSTWTEYTHTFTTNTLVGKTFGTSNDDYVSIVFQYAWGTDYDGRVGASTAETYGGSGTIDIAQVRMIAGGVAHPFQPISPSQELSNCQRYCYGITTPAAGYMASDLGYAASTTHAYPIVKLPVTMRRAPTTLTATAGDWQLADGVSAGVDVTAIAMHLSNADRVMLDCTVASGLTQYRSYSLISDSGGARTLYFEAEL